MNLERLVPRMIGGAVGGLALSFISGWGLFGSGHGGALEEMGLTALGYAGVLLGPIVGAVVAVYSMRVEPAKKGDEQAEIVWALWVLASALGWTVGLTVAILAALFVAEGLIGAPLTSMTGVMDVVMVRAIVGAIAGALLGIAHGFVLRQRVVLHPGLWVLASAVGGAVGWVAVEVADLGTSPISLGEAQFGLEVGAMAGAMFGASLGVAQWLVLRRQVSQAGWWALASAMAWAVGWAVGWALGGPGPFILPGALCGVISGAAMVWLLDEHQPDGGGDEIRRVDEKDQDVRNQGD